MWNIRNLPRKARHPGRPSKQKQLATLAGLIMAQAFAPMAEASVTVADPKDMADPSGDIRAISARVEGDLLVLSLSVDGTIAPSVALTPEGMVNRYYYHWLIDTDNNPATGRSNSEYEGNPTGLAKPIGSERVIMVGWRDGRPNGVEIYDPADEDNAIATGFSYLASGNTITAIIPLQVLGLVKGQTVAVSAFQEGASNNWQVDWVESATLTLSGPSTSSALIADPADLPDTNGDIRGVGGFVMGDHAFLWMNVDRMAAPPVDQTLEGKVNRYYYHWLLDTDNNPATGRSNSEYEGNPTGLAKPIGAERVVMIGWRDGKPNGVEVYDPADEDNAILRGFSYQVGGNTLAAIVPLSALGVVKGQTVGLSAFQEGASDDWLVDWVESANLTFTGPNRTVAAVADPQDLPDPSGDIRGIIGHVVGDQLHLSMTVEGVGAPSVEQTAEGKVNRYYYHWLLDTDNNPATGRSNAEYEGNPTGLAKPIGTERVIMIGWRDGKPNGLEVYDPADEDNAILSYLPFQASGNTLTTVVPLADLGLTAGQTVGFSAFQEGASDGWLVDWIESSGLLLKGPSGQTPVASINDPKDIADANGDIKTIEATVDGTDLVLRMSVYGHALPSVEQTGEGMVNRHYYHWLIDADNNPATGRSNSEYEGNPTGLTRPIGTELVIMIGWRNGAPNGVYAYNPLNEEVALVENFEYEVDGDMIEARLPMAALGLVMGQTVSVSGFQEGASNDWQVDWVESKELTLSSGELPGISLETVFDGNAYGYTIVLTDAGAQQADPSTVKVWLDSNSVSPTTTKNGGTTTITGQHNALLSPNTVHTLRLSLKVGNEEQSRDFVFAVPNYTVLPLAGKLDSVDTSKKGFLAHVTQISTIQTFMTSLHENQAELAEQQLAGEFVNPETNLPYVNEADPDQTQDRFVVPHTVVEGVINWFEHAEGIETLINFPGDEVIPHIFFGEGVVIELLTYLDLEEGHHKLGLFTEGAHKVNAGLTAEGPVLSQFDNSDGTARVPTYYSRNQFFDVVAPEDGYYPIRVLWFQSKRDQEPGLMLEFFSVEGRTLHLVNGTSPEAIKAYRAGWLADPNRPTLGLSRSGGNLVITYTGKLEAANAVNGEWNVIGEANQSPMTLQNPTGIRFFRAKMD